MKTLMIIAIVGMYGSLVGLIVLQIWLFFVNRRYLAQDVKEAVNKLKENLCAKDICKGDYTCFTCVAIDKIMGKFK